MRIVLWGVETNNKGAELMLYAILQEIERKWPDAKVYIPYSRCKQGLNYIKTILDFKYTPFSKFVYKTHLGSIFKRLHLPNDWLALTNIVKRCDWFIDGSGFAFSDQFNIKDERLKMWKTMLENLHKQGSKIVFLPQAFGPVELPNTKEVLKLVSDNASIIMSREQVSYSFLKESGVVNMDNVKIYTDFTSPIKGTFPVGYDHLRNGICIIPNMKMISQGKMSYEDYVRFVTLIIDSVHNSGHIVYLLNHEGIKDEQLAYKCQKSIGGDLEVVTGLNALEVKGLIASAYLVVTSRFHGLVSALNSCVPALATSWSHKYEELYRDYGLEGNILSLGNIENATKCINKLVCKDENIRVRHHLFSQLSKINCETCRMWEDVWNI